MKHITRILCLAALLAAPFAAKPAQAQPASPQQIQSLIANGQEQSALSNLSQILQAHPDSGVAWYLTAEAQDASGNEAAASSALAKAEQFSPGLPFANPNDVAALQAHLTAPAPTPAHGISPSALVIGGLVVLFLILRLFLRPRRSMPVYPQSYGAPPPYGPPGGMGYGPGPGPGMGMGGGLGSSILSGLAAGAGFAAGERIIDDLSGRQNQVFDPGLGQNFDPNTIPNRDDGLTGNPGWDDDSNQNDPGNGGFDPNNSW